MQHAARLVHAKGRLVRHRKLTLRIKWNQRKRQAQARKVDSFLVILFRKRALASSPRPAADLSDALPRVAAFRRSSVRRTASLRFLPVSQYSKESLVLLSAPDD